jgi:hypothetical protein
MATTSVVVSLLDAIRAQSHEAVVAALARGERAPGALKAALACGEPRITSAVVAAYATSALPSTAPAPTSVAAPMASVAPPSASDVREPTRRRASKKTHARTSARGAREPPALVAAIQSAAPKRVREPGEVQDAAAARVEALEARVPVLEAQLVATRERLRVARGRFIATYATPAKTERLLAYMTGLRRRWANRPNEQVPRRAAVTEEVIVRLVTTVTGTPAHAALPIEFWSWRITNLNEDDDVAYMARLREPESNEDLRVDVPADGEEPGDPRVPPPAIVALLAEYAITMYVDYATTRYMPEASGAQARETTRYEAGASYGYPPNRAALTDPPRYRAEDMRPSMPPLADVLARPHTNALSGAPKRERDDDAAPRTADEQRALVASLERQERFAEEALAEVRATLRAEREALVVVSPQAAADVAAVRAYLARVRARFYIDNDDTDTGGVDDATVDMEIRHGERVRVMRDEYARVAVHNRLPPPVTGAGVIRARPRNERAPGLGELEQYAFRSHPLAHPLNDMRMPASASVRPSAAVEAALARLGLTVTVSTYTQTYVNGEEEGDEELDGHWAFGAEPYGTRAQDGAAWMEREADDAGTVVARASATTRTGGWFFADAVADSVYAAVPASYTALHAAMHAAGVPVEIPGERVLVYVPTAGNASVYDMDNGRLFVDYPVGKPVPGIIVALARANSKVGTIVFPRPKARVSGLVYVSDKRTVVSIQWGKADRYKHAWTMLAGPDKCDATRYTIIESAVTQVDDSLERAAHRALAYRASDRETIQFQYAELDDDDVPELKSRAHAGVVAARTPASGSVRSSHGLHDDDDVLATLETTAGETYVVVYAPARAGSGDPPTMHSYELLRARGRLHQGYARVSLGETGVLRLTYASIVGDGRGRRLCTRFVAAALRDALSRAGYEHLPPHGAVEVAAPTEARAVVARACYTHAFERLGYALERVEPLAPRADGGVHEQLVFRHAHDGAWHRGE